MDYKELISIFNKGQRAKPIKFFSFIVLFLMPVMLFATPGAMVTAPITPTPAVNPAAPQKTNITSETLEMVSGTTENTFYFSKNVNVVGTNLRMKADQMVVTAQRTPETGGTVGGGVATPAPTSTKAGSPSGTIEKIVAVGDVHLYQTGRESISGRAEFFPKEGKVILTENPRVIDAKSIVSGWRITLYQGEHKVTVEEDPAGTARPTVNLDAMPNLGFDPAKDPQPATTPVATPAK